MGDILTDLQIPLNDNGLEHLALIAGCAGWAVYLKLDLVVDPVTGVTEMWLQQQSLIRFGLADDGWIVVREVHPGVLGTPDAPGPPVGRLEAAVNQPAYRLKIAPRLLSAAPPVEQIRRILAAGPSRRAGGRRRGPVRARRPGRTRPVSALGGTRPGNRWG